MPGTTSIFLQSRIPKGIVMTAIGPTLEGLDGERGRKRKKERSKTESPGTRKGSSKGDLVWGSAGLCIQ